MISSRPEFLENEHFRINRKAGKKWRYTTLRTTRIVLDTGIDETISFRDRNGVEWMRIAPWFANPDLLPPPSIRVSLLSIRDGYSWDGATMVPDGGLYLETLVHDALYQFRLTEHFPLTRRECDDAFLDLMKLGRFPRPLALVYWRGVRMFGGAFKGGNGEWSKVLTTHTV